MENYSLNDEKLPIYYLFFLTPVVCFELKLVSAV